MHALYPPSAPDVGARVSAASVRTSGRGSHLGGAAGGLDRRDLRPSDVWSFGVTCAAMFAPEGDPYAHAAPALVASSRSLYEARPSFYLSQ